jgi:hypothetical protein
MAGSTPNLGLYLPGGGSTGTVVPDETADIDPLNENFRKIDTAIGDPAEQNRQWYGPAASIGTVPVDPKDGDTYQESDGNKILWKRLGGVWVSGENGMYLLRPASVTGGTVDASGKIIPPHNGPASTAVIASGCFSDRFNSYRIDYSIVLSAGAGMNFRLSAGGAAHAGLNYTYQYVSASVGSLGSNRNTNQSEQAVTSSVSTRHNGTVEIWNARLAGAPKFIRVSNTSLGPDMFNSFGILGNAGGDALIADGFTFQTGAAVNWNSSSGQSWFKIYGLA